MKKAIAHRFARWFDLMASLALKLRRCLWSFPVFHECADLLHPELLSIAS
jgi:hypothetical protein